MMILKDEILIPYAEKANLVHQDPYFDEEIRSKYISNQFQESVRASAKLEELLLKQTKSEIELKTGVDAKIVMDGIYSAWKWAEKNYEGIITKNLIAEIGYHLDTQTNSQGIRTSAVKMGGVKYSPPSYPQKIELKLNEFCEKVNFYKKPLEKAIFAHLNCFIVHPLYDCNKRTARILQNLILKQEKLPPIIIDHSEGQFYHDLLIDAFESFYARGGKDSPSNSEMRFYEFLGTKALAGINDVFNKLSNEKKFKLSVNLKKKDKSGYLCIKKTIQCLMRRRNIKGKIKLIPNNANQYEIKGNLEANDLHAILDSFNFIKDYEISPHKRHN